MKIKVRVLKPDGHIETFTMLNFAEKSEYGEDFLKFFDDRNYVHHINKKFILEITE
jgi:hypothetical protein